MNKFWCKFLFAIALNIFLHAVNIRHHPNTYILLRAYLKKKYNAIRKLSKRALTTEIIKKC